jgi:hypothetical protein
MTVRSLALLLGSGPPALTAMTISFPNRVNTLDILSQRLNFRSFLNSNALPMDMLFIGNKNSNFFSWKKCNFSKQLEGLWEGKLPGDKECFFGIKPKSSD